VRLRTEPTSEMGLLSPGCAAGVRVSCACISWNKHLELRWSRNIRLQHALSALVTSLQKSIFLLVVGVEYV